MTPQNTTQAVEFTTSIRPLTASEYQDIMTGADIELRISDGTSDGTWRFWTVDGNLFYRRLSWTQNKPCETSFLQSILDDGGTTQLVAPTDS